MYLVSVVARVWLGRGTAVVAFSSATASTIAFLRPAGNSALYPVFVYNWYSLVQDGVESRHKGRPDYVV